MQDVGDIALHYAFCQFDDPASWKFNKAKQNWLIRNIWSQQAVRKRRC